MMTVAIVSSLICVYLVFVSQIGQARGIINGADALDGEFPYMVSILNESNSHYCGGSLISQQHVLTAGHCFYKDVTVFDGEVDEMYPPEDVFVMVDTVAYDWSTGRIYPVKRLTPHPLYNVSVYDSLLYDIGIITLKYPVRIPGVLPIKPSQTPHKIGMPGTLVGWGVSKHQDIETKKVSSVLQKVEMIVHNFNECKVEYDKLPELGWVIPSLETALVFCAFKEDAGACYRDSGSPLTQDGQLVGVVIFGNPCAKGTPDIFTTVSGYLDFINDVLQDYEYT